MKKIKMFYLTNCPYCRKAFKYLEELQKDEQYANIEIEKIEESKQKDIANSYDYYYVPCFYIDENKVFEGAASLADVQAVLDKAK